MYSRVRREPHGRSPQIPEIKVRSEIHGSSRGWAEGFEGPRAFQPLRRADVRQATGAFDLPPHPPRLVEKLRIRSRNGGKDREP